MWPADDRWLAEDEVGEEADLFAGALAAFLAARAQLHDLVMLDLLNHLPRLGGDAALAYHRAALTQLAIRTVALRG